jgi:hypothetical protein
MGGFFAGVFIGVVFKIIWDKAEVTAKLKE